ncbi:MAG: hypothetical protein AB7E95_09875 [Kiritimatiellales bacterium]
MKTTKLEKWLLLEQTGELSAKQLRVLGRELEASEEARTLRDALNRLSRAVDKTTDDPDPWVVTKINARLRAEQPHLSLVSRVWKPVLALAACLLAVAGIWSFHGTDTPVATVASVAPAAATVKSDDGWTDPFEEDLEELENLIVAISGYPLDIMEM